jgi:hypothetical protein
VAINRPERKNAVDKTTAEALYKAFREFDEDDTFSVAILTGAGQFALSLLLVIIGNWILKTHVLRGNILCRSR